jgi:hypothetical protein
MNTNNTMLEALKAAEPVLADLDRMLKMRQPGFPGLQVLGTVREAIAVAADLSINELKNTGDLQRRESDRALADQVKH